MRGSFTPIRTFWLTAVCSALVVAYGIVINNVSDLKVAYADRFDILGVLALFVILNAFVGYLLEMSLRQTFLSEYLLYASERTLKTQQKVSNDLLQAMLPLTVIEQVQSQREELVVRQDVVYGCLLRCVESVATLNAFLVTCLVRCS